jgi:hypothetical protein
MSQPEATQETQEALRRVAELELRWQDQRAQRHRAWELFYADVAALDETDDDD